MSKLGWEVVEERERRRPSVQMAVVLRSSADADADADAVSELSSLRRRRGICTASAVLMISDIAASEIFPGYPSMG